VHASPRDTRHTLASSLLDAASSPSGRVLAAVLAVVLMLSACGKKPGADAAGAGASAPAAAASGSAAAALTVEAVRPQRLDWALRLSAHGPGAAWQEAIVGAELGGQRLLAVQADVGDVVRRGQVLASFSKDAVSADEQVARAALAEAEALAQEAHANADRIRKLQGSGALSPQDAQRTLTAEATANARLSSAKAQVATQSLRLKQTQVLAPDDGVVASRSATVGAVGQAGQELFRLVRQGRLQWRAEVPASDLPRVQPGQVASLSVPGVAQPIAARVRVVSPTVDTQTRNGIVFVDLPAAALKAGVRPGMFASGQIDLGSASGLTLPQTAVALQDGFNYVFLIEGREGRQVRRVKVQVGRREGDRIEVLSGLKPDAQVVAAGVGLLTDGDTVRVVAASGAQP
jgi:HlyD family secretion protein